MASKRHNNTPRSPGTSRPVKRTRVAIPPQISEPVLSPVNDENTPPVQNAVPLSDEGNYTMPPRLTSEIALDILKAVALQEKIRLDRAIAEREREASITRQREIELEKAKIQSHQQIELVELRNEVKELRENDKRLVARVAALETLCGLTPAEHMQNQSEPPVLSHQPDSSHHSNPQQDTVGQHLVQSYDLSPGLYSPEQAHALGPFVRPVQQDPAQFYGFQQNSAPIDPLFHLADNRIENYYPYSSLAGAVPASYQTSFQHNEHGY